MIFKRSPQPVLIEAELIDFLDRFDALLPQMLRRELSLLMDMRGYPRDELEHEEPLTVRCCGWALGFGGWRC